VRRGQISRRLRRPCWLNVGRPPAHTKHKHTGGAFDHGTIAFYDPVRTYAAFKDWVPLKRALACNIERSLSQ
jgi:hypothetical protein